MASKKQEKPAFATCEICGQACDADERCGCEKCGRMFGPCCNSEDDSVCVECV